MNTEEENDARAVLSLLGDVAMMRGSHRRLKIQLLKGLANLIDADAWLWGHAPKPGTDAAQAFSAFIWRGMGPIRLAKLARAANHPDAGKASEGFYVAALAADGRNVTLSNAQLDPDNLAHQGATRRTLARLRGRVYPVKRALYQRGHRQRHCALSERRARTVREPRNRTNADGAR